MSSKNNLLSASKNKKLRLGSYSVFASIIVIAIAVAAIVLAERLPSSYTKIDMTPNQLYSLSEQTKSIVSGLTETVDIYLLAEHGKEDSNITKILQRYQEINSNINVIIKDPVVNPSFAKQYTDETLSQNSLIIVSGTKSQYIKYNDIYTADYSAYMSTGSYTTQFNGEGCLTGAIDYVINQRLSKIYVLTGHGEKNFSTSFENMLKKQNISIQNLSLLSAEVIPEDCECLVVISPQKDISKSEKEKVMSYLKDGGNLLLLTDYLENTLENFTEITQYYGVSLADGIVLEQDMNYYVSGYPNVLIPNLQPHEILTPLINSRYAVLAADAQGILTAEDKREEVVVTELLKTSGSAYSKVNLNASTLEKESDDISGPLSLAVAMEEGATRVIWFSTSAFLDDSLNEVVSGANFDMLLNSVSWMCEIENGISIHAKNMDSARLTVPAQDSYFLSIALAGVLPLICILCGIAVWIRRRHR